MFFMPWHRAAYVLFSLSLLTLVFAYPLSIMLPATWSYENQPIENAQVVILAISVLGALRFFQIDRDPIRWVGLAAALVLMVMIARELSWGAVFFDPTSLSEHGPLFSSQALWYRPVVVPTTAALLICSIAIILIKRLHNLGFALLKPIRLSILLSILLTVVGMLISGAAEGHVSALPITEWVNDGDIEQLLEETAELGAYLAMVAGLFFIFSELQKLPAEEQAS